MDETTEQETQQTQQQEPAGYVRDNDTPKWAKFAITKYVVNDGDIEEVLEFIPAAPASIIVDTEALEERDTATESFAKLLESAYDTLQWLFEEGINTEELPEYGQWMRKVSSIRPVVDPVDDAVPLKIVEEDNMQE